MKYLNILFLLLLISYTHQYQITLKQPLTCHRFKSQDVDQLREFYISYRNPQNKKVILQVTDLRDNILNTTRNINQTHLYLSVTTKQIQQYKFCFIKNFPEDQLIQFEIIDEKYLIEHISGKEDVEKVISSAKKMIQHLEKVSINQKSLLMDHNRRTEDLKQTSSELKMLGVFKILIIIIVTISQVGIVKRIFK